MLGEQQERWLLDGLAASQTKWKVLVTVMVILILVRNM